ncbi:MAG TPA: type II toxin-antitoxin system VapB family antitoxin [Baekduia sp.]|nr:type II toxin-antitoxin system VapB family antitoxin [Baekduia sp.]
MAKMRTNIEIEERYVTAIMERYDLKTKTEAVDLALRRVAGEPMSKEEALAMRGANLIEHVPIDRSIYDK